MTDRKIKTGYFQTLKFNADAVPERKNRRAPRKSARRIAGFRIYFFRLVQIVS